MGSHRVSGGRLIVLLVIGALAIPNFYAIWLTLQGLFTPGMVGTDWPGLATGPGQVWTDGLYQLDAGAFRYSPLVATAMGAVGPIGLIAWRVLHLAALAFLPSWRLAGLTLLFFPFWADLYAGNGLTFAFVAAAAAIAGSRIGTGAFLLCCVLMPHPLFLPVAAWLLWQRGEWRWPFLGAIVVHGALVAATGLGDEWLVALAASAAQIGAPWDVSPARFIGILWIPIGLTLAVICTIRGNLGLASLYASPYWLYYYPLMILLQLVPKAAPRVPAATEVERPLPAPSREPIPIRIRAD